MEVIRIILISPKTSKEGASNFAKKIKETIKLSQMAKPPTRGTLFLEIEIFFNRRNNMLTLKKNESRKKEKCMFFF